MTQVKDENVFFKYKIQVVQQRTKYVVIKLQKQIHIAGFSGVLTEPTITVDNLNLSKQSCAIHHGSLN